MNVSTYSFEDVICTVHNGAGGSFSTQGQGVGSITISMSNDRTQHDVAADGSVMISKIDAENGTIALEVQQTSQVNKDLLDLYNYLSEAPAEEWATTTVTISSKNMGEKTTCTNVSFTKLADKPYQQTGQRVTWNLMAAKIVQENV